MATRAFEQGVALHQDSVFLCDLVVEVGATSAIRVGSSLKIDDVTTYVRAANDRGQTRWATATSGKARCRPPR